MLSTNGDTARRTPAFLRVPAALGAALLLIGALTAPTITHAASGWELVLDRPTPNFGGMDFVSENEGWLVAGAGLLHTTDGGATWEENAKLSGTDVDFADADHGWLVGGSGAIYATTDGGETWEEQDSGTAVHLANVVAISTTEAVVIGSDTGFGDVVEYPLQSAFLRTHDGGLTWQDVETPAASRFGEVGFAGRHGWALGTVCSESEFCSEIHDVLLLSTDGGATWKPSSDGLPIDPHEIVFVNDQEAWMLGQLEQAAGLVPYVFHSTDGGATWEPQLTTGHELESFDGLTFLNKSDGWALLRGATGDMTVSNRLMATSNGGASWQEVGTVPRMGAAFANQPVSQGIAMYAFGDSQRSLDGGLTWEVVSQPALTLYSITFVDDTLGYAAGSPGGILRTDDAGANWAPASAQPPSANHVIFLDKELGFAVNTWCCSPRLDIQRTSDTGATWSTVHSSRLMAGSSLLDSYFDGRTGWIAFENGVVVTADGGLTWEERLIDDPARRLLDVVLVSSEEGWATRWPLEAGGQPTLTRTHDGGRTWSEVAAPLAPSWAQDMTAVSPTHVWYTTSDCEGQDCALVLVSSSDGGLEWREQRLGPESAMNHSMVFTDPLNGWISIQDCYCAEGLTRIAHTADGGLTWQDQISGNYTAGETLFIGDFKFVDPKTGWFLLSPSRGWGPGGGPPNRTLLYHTTDGGGGAIGEPMPTIELPDVGSAEPSAGSGHWPPVLLLAGLALAGGALIARWRTP